MFYICSDPNIGDYAPITEWQPMTVDNNEYYDINECPSMRRNLYKQRYRVWNKLFPIENRCR